MAAGPRGRARAAHRALRGGPGSGGRAGAPRTPAGGPAEVRTRTPAGLRGCAARPRTASGRLPASPTCAGRPHLLDGRLEVEVTGLLQVQPDHGHAGHGLHGALRPAPLGLGLPARPPSPSAPEVPRHAGTEAPARPAGKRVPSTAGTRAPLPSSHACSPPSDAAVWAVAKGLPEERPSSAAAPRAPPRGLGVGGAPRGLVPMVGEGPGAPVEAPRRAGFPGMRPVCASLERGATGWRPAVLRGGRRGAGTCGHERATCPRSEMRRVRRA